MKICFFCKISDKSKLFIVEFYNQDIKILKKIDPSLTIATKYSEIDWSADVIFCFVVDICLFSCSCFKAVEEKSCNNRNF